MDAVNSISVAEEWRKVPGFPAYEVSSLGKIRSYWKRMGPRCPPPRMRMGDAPKMLKQNCVQDRLFVTLSDGQGRVETWQVGRVVLMAFGRLPNEGEEALHGPDPNPHNNWIGNLRWGTRKQNLADMIQQRGRHATGKLMVGEVTEIRRLLARGHADSRIARWYEVSGRTIGLIKMGETHLVAGQEAIGEVEPVQLIRRTALVEVTAADLCRALGLPEGVRIIECRGGDMDDAGLTTVRLKLEHPRLKPIADGKRAPRLTLQEFKEDRTVWETV